MRAKWVLLRLAVVFGCLGVCAPASAHWEDIPDLLLLVNQSGYETDGFKHFLVQSKKPLFEVEGEFSLTDETGKAIFTGKLGPVVQVDWAGRHKPWFRKGIFTEFNQPGTYRITTKIGSGTYTSYPFEIGDRILIKKTAWLASKFFNGQRCGDKNFLHSACHLDDAVLAHDEDVQVEASGGWHDAGNYPKMALTISLGTYGLARFAASEAYKSYVHADKNIPTPLQEAIWGAAYLRKIQDPTSHRLLGNVDYRVSRLSPEHLELLQTRGRNRQWEYFLPPDECTDNKPGTGDERVLGYAGLPTAFSYHVYEGAGGRTILLPIGGSWRQYPPLVCVADRRAEVSAILPPAKGGEVLKQGMTVYVDRDYTLTSFDLPGGGRLIRTFNDHRDERSAGITFKLGRKATVYVALDSRNPTRPDWLRKNRFKKTDLKFTVSNSQGEEWDYVTHVKEFRAGEVKLGANLPEDYTGEVSGCNYFVVFRLDGQASKKVAPLTYIRYRLPSVKLEPEAGLYSASRRVLRKVPKPLEKAVFFRQFRTWPEGYSLKIEASKLSTVYLAFDPSAGELYADAKRHGFERSDFELELWEHRFTGSGWGYGFTRSNGYTVATYACLYQATGEKRYLDDALKLWQTIIHDPSDVMGDTAILMADTELCRIRKEPRFLEDATRRIHRLIAKQSKEGNWPGQSGGPYSMHEGDVASALADHLLAVPKTPAARDARRALKKYVKWSRALSHNIFRIKQVSRERILSSGGRTAVYTAQARALRLAQRVLGEDEELDEIATACTDWILGLNSYGICLMSGAGSKHMSRYWAYYRPEELPGSSGAGIVAGSSTSDIPYLDVRARGTRRANGDGQTGEPSIHRGGLWMLMLSDY